MLEGLGPHKLLDSLKPFLEQLNPILTWLSEHQQLTSDFITAGGASLFPRTLSLGGNGTGHYLRQFGPVGAETLSFQSNRDSDNRGNTYPEPLWLPAGEKRDFTLGNLPSWDCRNTGAGGTGDTNGKSAVPPQQPCWTQPQLPGAPGVYKVPTIQTKTYSSK